MRLRPQRYYVLDDDKVARPASIQEWYAWIRQPGKMQPMAIDTYASDTEMPIVVTTNFLGQDQSTTGEYTPMVFETRVICGVMLPCGRILLAPTWNQALDMHEKMCATIEECIPGVVRQRIMPNVKIEAPIN